MVSRFGPPDTLPFCELAHNCKLVCTGKCPNRHRDCHHGIGCWKLERRKCTYYHPPEHFEQVDFIPWCDLDDKCKKVCTGECPKRHRDCNYGINCRRLRERKCTYYHPRNHFELVPKIESATRDNHNSNSSPRSMPNTNTNYININTNTNSNNNKNNTNKSHKVIEKLHHTKPKRSNKSWEVWEDRILIKYIEQYPNDVTKKDVISKIENDFENGRSKTAIITRIRKIKDKMNKEKNEDNKPLQNNNNNTEKIEVDEYELHHLQLHSQTNNNTKNNTNNNKMDDEETDSEHEHAASANNIMHSRNHNNENAKRKQTVYCIIKKLIRYYKFEKNGYDKANLERVFKELKDKRWNGNEKTRKQVMQCELQYFKEKLNKLEIKYGKIEQETEEKIMNTLKEVKKSLKDILDNIKKAEKEIKASDWLGSQVEFEKITKLSLDDINKLQKNLVDYNDMKSINGAIFSLKDEVDDDHKDSNSSMPALETDNNHNNQNENKQAEPEPITMTITDINNNDGEIEQSDDDHRIKREDSDSDRNRDRRHRHRHRHKRDHHRNRDRSRDRSRSRERDRDRYRRSKSSYRDTTRSRSHRDRDRDRDRERDRDRHRRRRSKSRYRDSRSRSRSSKR